MGKILPILLALIGLGAGIGGGIALRPNPEDQTLLTPCGEDGDSHTTVSEAEQSGNVETDQQNSPDYVKLNNQFVVPVVQDGSVTALVVMSLSLELNSGGPELVYQREPKLRDALLQVLFDHANAGGFDGNFTSGRNMEALRRALRESAINTLGPEVSDVLIVDVVRQEA